MDDTAVRFQRRHQFVDRLEHARTALVVAEVQDVGTTAEEVPVHQSIGPLRHGLDPALDGVGTSVECDHGLAFLEDPRVAGRRTGTIAGHGNLILSCHVQTSSCVLPSAHELTVALVGVIDGNDLPILCLAEEAEATQIDGVLEPRLLTRFMTMLLPEPPLFIGPPA